MNDTEFKKFESDRREFITKKYLEYTDSQGYNHLESVSTINYFWNRVNYYPSYLQECEKYHNSHKNQYTGIMTINESKYPDYDWAALICGISMDYIHSLALQFLDTYNSSQI